MSIEPFATFINGVAKHVATSAPLDPRWTNAHVIDGDLVEFARRLKDARTCYSHLAGRLYDRLAVRLGEDQVFMDVDRIELGVDFAEVITRATWPVKS